MGVRVPTAGSCARQPDPGTAPWSTQCCIRKGSSGCVVFESQSANGDTGVQRFHCTWRLKGIGVKVPEEISVVGFDDIPDAANELFSLTTLRQDTKAQAHAAVSSLQALLGKKGKPAKLSRMSVELIVRRSTGICARTGME